MTTGPRGSVLDASALLAYLNAEPGGAFVRAHLPQAAISALNWSEVLQKAAVLRLSSNERSQQLAELGLVIIPFDETDAEMAAALWTRASNLSLADRVCLALASRLNLPVLTADRIWATLDLGVDVQIIR